MRGSSSNRSISASAACRVQPAAQPPEHVDRLAAGQVGPQVDLARHVRQPPVQGDRVAPRVAAEQPDVARVGAQEPEQHADGGRLARAVGAEEAVHLPRADGEVEPVERALGAERLDEPADRDGVGHDFSLSCRSAIGVEVAAVGEEAVRVELEAGEHGAARTARSSPSPGRPVGATPRPGGGVELGHDDQARPGWRRPVAPDRRPGPPTAATVPAVSPASRYAAASSTSPSTKCAATAPPVQEAAHDVGEQGRVLLHAAPAARSSSAGDCVRDRVRLLARG